MRFRTVVALAAAPVLVSCASSPAAEEAAAAASPVSTMSTTWAATISPRAAVGTQISGRVRLIPTGRANELRVDGSVRGAGMTTRLPWTIREGNCGENGRELGSPVSYREISFGADGSAMMTGTIPVAVPTSGTYHIAILANSMERDRVVACGVLSPTQ